MKKPIKSFLNAEFEVKKDYSCQACHINEAVIKLQGSGWLAPIQGNFCKECALKKLNTGIVPICLNLT